MTINPVNIDATRYAIAYGVPGVEGWIPGFEDSHEAAEVRIMEFAADEADWDEWGECQFTYTIVPLAPIPAPFSGQSEQWVDWRIANEPDEVEDAAHSLHSELDGMPDDWPPHPLLGKPDADGFYRDWRCI